MTLEEILAALKAEIGDDKEKAKAAAESMRGTVPIVAQVLIDAGAGRKGGELARQITRLEQERDNAIAERDEATTALEELKTKTPNAAEIEAGVKARYEKKLKDAQDENAQLKGDLTSERKGTTLGRLRRRLEQEHRVDPEWTETALDSRYGNRIEIGADGAKKILQLDGTEAYDGSEDEAIEKLASDIAKKVPERWITTNADSGGGVGGGGGRSNGKPNEKQVESKRRSGAYAL